jgi:putative acetyltransferase
MTLNIRQMRPEDARSFLEVHHAAVRETAARDYPSAVIENWAPLPITDDAVKRLLANPANEIRLVAEINSEIVGIGALILEKTELRACYVAPNAARRGIGSALVREIERITTTYGLSRLELDASITSEPFYKALGYEVRERGEHVLGSGQRMACVKMHKHLSPQ